MIKDNGDEMRPTAALSGPSDNPVNPAKVMTGMPTDPNATGAVLASKQMLEAWNRLIPSPTSIEPAMATGAPKPAAPSINAPNPNAINKTCRRASPVNWAMDSLMISNWPVSSVSRYKKIAGKTIQHTGNSPKAAP